MTLIITLPAGTYRVTSTVEGSILPCEVRKNTLGGRTRTDELAVWYNHVDVCNRSEMTERYMRIRGRESGPAEFMGKHGAIVVMEGAADLRPRANHQCFDVASNRGAISCSKTMAIVPVDKAEPHMFRTGAAYWYDVVSDEPIEVRYDDLVLQVGDLRIDQKADYALDLRGTAFAPGSILFDLLKPDCKSSDPQTYVTTEMLLALEAMADVPSDVTDHVRNCMTTHGMCTLRYSVDSGPDLTIGRDVHISSARHPGVVRKGSALYDLLKPRFDGNRIWVDDIGDDLANKVRAIGDEAVGMILDTFRYNRKIGHRDAVFTPYVD